MAEFRRQRDRGRRKLARHVDLNVLSAATAQFLGDRQHRAYIGRFDNHTIQSLEIRGRIRGHAGDVDSGQPGNIVDVSVNCFDRKSTGMRGNDNIVPPINSEQNRLARASG